MICGSDLMYIDSRNRPNQEILVPEWLITSHVTYITCSDWLFTWSGRLLIERAELFGEFLTSIIDTDVILN